MVQHKQQSFSPCSGNHYAIPPTADDSAMVEFLDRHPDRQVVAVQGLGFVGLAMSLVISDSEAKYSVVGVDLPTPDIFWRIADINHGICPVVSSDPEFLRLFELARENDRFLATHSVLAYAHASVIVVDVNLDVQKKRAADGDLEAYDVCLDNFRAAIRAIGENCRPDALVIVETTVPPGTCKNVVTPILKNELGKRGLDSSKIKVGHSYERVMPGPNYINSIKNFYRVYSGIDSRSADATEAFLRTVISTDEYPLTRLKTTEATEMAKVLENSYRAMNISFAVEWSRFAENAGVDLYEVVNAIRQRPTHANLMYPGIGVGGYCLTKDPLMASWGSQHFFDLEGGLPSSVNAVKINDQMPNSALEFVEKCLPNGLRDLRVALLGVAYGPGIGDTRSSPVEPFAKGLMRLGALVTFCDPYVHFWPEMGMEVSQSVKELLAGDPDVLMITTAHQRFVEDDVYTAIRSSTSLKAVMDLVGLLDRAKLEHDYILGRNFFTLGVGVADAGL